MSLEMAGASKRVEGGWEVSPSIKPEALDLIEPIPSSSNSRSVCFCPNMDERCARPASAACVACLPSNAQRNSSGTPSTSFARSAEEAPTAPARRGKELTAR